VLIDYSYYFTFTLNITSNYLLGLSGATDKGVPKMDYRRLGKFLSAREPLCGLIFANDLMFPNEETFEVVLIVKPKKR